MRRRPGCDRRPPTLAPADLDRLLSIGENAGVAATFFQVTSVRPDRWTMVFEQIEKLKRDYTDKYVVVDADRPELARFGGQVGLVKTINMNGRALVEFQDYIANIGWFDIELDFLKVVPKPEAGAAVKAEKPVAKKPAAGAAKAAAEAPAKSPAAAGKKPSAIELARMQGAAKGATAPSPAKAKPAGTGAALAEAGRRFENR